MQHRVAESPARPRAYIEDWCRRLDGGPYPAYRDLSGRFELDNFILEVLRVQPDPFAGPSRIRLLIPYSSTALDAGTGSLSGGEMAARPGLVDRRSSRAVAIRDYLGRRAARWCAKETGGAGRRPALAVERHGQQVCERSALFLRPAHLELRLQCDLPARGRRILGREAASLLLRMPERLVGECFGAGSLDLAALRRHADVVEDFAFLQEELDRRGWIGFVADGSRLARRAGHDDRPLVGESVVDFESPLELRREVSLPHAGPVPGMALEPGVTLLCGGGFHGKSTLLRALAAAVVPHIPGDGRERMATRADAQSVRAEDGRAVTGVDLRPFLHDLPGGRAADSFTTDNASGSTSQAAAILEAIQGGSRLLLMDEDTSATNFMIRDALMERLLQARQEPITPFLDRARTLFENLGVSTILVIGGSGEYFRVADRVLLLDTYRPCDRSPDAREIVRDRPAPVASDSAAAGFLEATGRDRALPPGPGGEPRIKAQDARRLLVGDTPLELPGLETMRETAQARFLALLLGCRFLEQARHGAGTLIQAASVSEAEATFREAWGNGGLDGFDRERRGDLAAVRFLDLLAALNRLRGRSDRAVSEAPEDNGGWD